MESTFNALPVSAETNKKHVKIVTRVRDSLSMEKDLLNAQKAGQLEVEDKQSGRMVDNDESVVQDATKGEYWCALPQPNYRVQQTSTPDREWYEEDLNDIDTKFKTIGRNAVVPMIALTENLFQILEACKDPSVQTVEAVEAFHRAMKMVTRYTTSQDSDGKIVRYRLIMCLAPDLPELTIERRVQILAERLAAEQQKLIELISLPSWKRNGILIEAQRDVVAVVSNSYKEEKELMDEEQEENENPVLRGVLHHVLNDEVVDLTEDDELPDVQDDELPDVQDDELTQAQIDELTEVQDDEYTEVQDDELTEDQDDEYTEVQDDELDDEVVDLTMDDELTEVQEGNTSHKRKIVIDLCESSDNYVSEDEYEPDSDESS